MANPAIDRQRDNKGFKSDEQINAEAAVAEARRRSWQDALRAAAVGMVGNGMDAQTMAGFAVGRWLSDYLARGRDKAEQRKNAGKTAKDQTTLEAYRNGQGGTAIGNEAWDEGTTYALQPGLLGGSADPSNFAKLASTENMLDTVGLGTGKYSNPITQATNDIIAQNFTGPNTGAGIDSSNIGQFFDNDKAITNMFRF